MSETSYFDSVDEWKAILPNC